MQGTSWETLGWVKHRLESRLLGEISITSAQGWGSWWAAVYGVAQSQTRLKQLSSSSSSCDPMDYSLPGSSVHGIFHPKYCSELPLPPPGDLPDAGIKHMSPVSPALAGRFFENLRFTEPLGKPPTISYEHLKCAIYFSRIISKNLTVVKDDYFI